MSQDLSSVCAFAPGERPNSSLQWQCVVFYKRFECVVRPTQIFVTTNCEAKWRFPLKWYLRYGCLGRNVEEKLCLHAPKKHSTKKQYLSPFRLDAWRDSTSQVLSELPLPFPVMFTPGCLNSSVLHQDPCFRGIPD